MKSSIKPYTIEFYEKNKEIGPKSKLYSEVILEFHQLNFINLPYKGDIPPGSSVLHDSAWSLAMCIHGGSK